MRYYCRMVIVTFFTMSMGFFSNLAQAEEKQVPQSHTQIQLSFAPLVKAARPAVVNVYATRKVKLRSPFEDDPFFQFFFSDDGFSSRSRSQYALGSGVIVDQTGIIVTNYHVINGADEVKIGLSDGREFASKILFKDEALDLALVKIDAKNIPLPTLSLADSDTVEAGDLVLAIGNPFGVGQTVTSGIVSAEARTHIGVAGLDFFIQTDAAINPGNSGGALINMNGQLIGINTAIYSRSGGSVGIGFAIPANLVRAVIESIKSGNKRFDPPYFGAMFQAVTSEIAESLGLNRAYGALITQITPNGPAAKAGLKVGDVLLTVEGKRIDNPESLSYRLLTSPIGRELNFTYQRNGKIYDTKVKLTILPKVKAGKSKKMAGNTPFSGATLAENQPESGYIMRKQRSRKGVLVVDIEAGSIAQNFFRKGDIIRSVNGVATKTLADLETVLKQNKPSMWRLEYEREGAIIQQFIR